MASGAIGIAAALLIGGCSSSGTTTAGSADEDTTIGTPDGTGETITVWAMAGDLSPESLDAINAEFTKVSGAKVDLVEQASWENIGTKITTALATSTPPDVIDVGNTQIPGYAATGGLLDLTPYKEELQQGNTWLTGLEAPATIDGALFGVPSFGGSRAVIYSKAIWAAAGITEVPVTYEELTADLDLIKAANTASDFSAFYYPGANWHSDMAWVWDAGGEIATMADGTWTGGFSSPEALEGLENFKNFQNTYSTVASQTLNNNKPEQAQLFADGKTAAIVGNPTEIVNIKKKNTALTDDDFGVFPFPGMSGEMQPVMLGGSDWGIAAKSPNPKLALLWAKIAASPEIQNTHVFAKDGWIPNSTQGIEDAQGTDLNPLTAGFFEAALKSMSTPAAASWPTIEGDLSVNQFFTSIATGTKTPAEAATDFDAHLDSVLNGN